MEVYETIEFYKCGDRIPKITLKHEDTLVSSTLISVFPVIGFCSIERKPFYGLVSIHKYYPDNFQSAIVHKQHMILTMDLRANAVYKNIRLSNHVVSYYDTAFKMTIFYESTDSLTTCEKNYLKLCLLT